MGRTPKILLAIFLVFTLAGCETAGQVIKRKFIPKKKEQGKKKVFYGYEEEYKPEFSNATLYNNHYVYWKSWEQELIEALKGNNEKKQIACARTSLDELLGMQRYLASPKKEELNPYIDELDRMTKKISAGNLSDGARATLRVSLERHRRCILRDFYLDRVRSFIRPDAGQ